jgi:hypothetical protein
MDPETTDTLCLDERRKAAVREHLTLNGIDFVESFEDRSLTPPQPPKIWLEVRFLKDAPAGLVGHPGAFTIEGGVRVTGIRATGVEALPEDSHRLKVILDNEGDFSTYVLRISAPGASLDPHLSAAPFRFRASCPSELDCRQEPDCPPEPLDEPALDYLAKDYASFRRLLLDLIPQRNPRWTERNPADVGMVLVELLAYRGDQLSYFQDAVATEAYLDTCRHRISARRHARLIDYPMHDGRNAWTFVQLEVEGLGVVPQGTKLLSRVDQPLRGQTAPPGTEIPSMAGLDLDGDPALREVTVFESTARVKTDPDNNELRLHTWADLHCCLPRGATSVHLFGVKAGQANPPPLNTGDYLLFEEVKGPATGLEADADPSHRQVVRITGVEDTEDLVFCDELAEHGELQEWVVGKAPLPLRRVTWDAREALRFPLCLSAVHPETGEPILRVSVARGNVVPCDHGRSVVDELPPPVPGGGRSARMQTSLPRGPLTFQTMPAEPTHDDDGRLKQSRHSLAASPSAVRPAVALILTFPLSETEVWTPVPDLLDSRPLDRHFVAEVDNDGRTILRFGDDEHGHRPSAVVSVKARYRIGNGKAGNLGRESLVHIVQPAAADMVDPAHPEEPPPPWPGARNLRHPLPAVDGTDPESVEEVRQLAPRAFHAETFRAVTETDYEEAARKLSSVAAAKCTFRWTGSWHTVFVAVHPQDPADLITEPDGGIRLRDDLAGAVRNHLARYRLAGYDLEVRTAQYVPLEIEIQLCIARGHFRGDVLAAAARALSNRRYTGGATGFFHPSRFSFSEDVYLSRLYTAVEHVEGVESAAVKVFKRYWAVANRELENGVIPLGDHEIARLDNDPSFPENGVLRLSAVGGL